MSTHSINNNLSYIQKETTNLILTPDSYYAELSADALDDQGCLLDALIHYTLDTLNVQHLDLRIVAEAHS
jgi:hypothetical protein